MGFLCFGRKKVSPQLEDAPAALERKPHMEYDLEQFDLFGTVGVGTFGRVRLARKLPDKRKRRRDKLLEERRIAERDGEDAVPPAGKGGAEDGSVHTGGGASLLSQDVVGSMQREEEEKDADDEAGVVCAIKVIRKASVVEMRQFTHVFNEISIMIKLDHPFLVRTWDHFQDDNNLYIVMDYYPGGDIFRHLREAVRFPEDQVRFYAAQIVLALEYLHAYGIMYRDIKPENVLLSADGYISLVDFGFSKITNDDKTFTLCGTAEYLAPEIVARNGYDRSVDWWALGVLVFEMLAGYPPFFDDTAFGIYQQVLNSNVKFPVKPKIRNAARQFVTDLMTRDVSQRLGCGEQGAKDVQRHGWMRPVDWAALGARQVEAPFRPTVNGGDDTSNYDTFEDEELESVADLNLAQRQAFARLAAV